MHAKISGSSTVRIDVAASRALVPARMRCASWPMLRSAFTLRRVCSCSSPSSASASSFAASTSASRSAPSTGERKSGDASSTWRKSCIAARRVASGKGARKMYRSAGSSESVSTRSSASSPLRIDACASLTKSVSARSEEVRIIMSPSQRSCSTHASSGVKLLSVGPNDARRRWISSSNASPRLAKSYAPIELPLVACRSSSTGTTCPSRAPTEATWLIEGRRGAIASSTRTISRRTTTSDTQVFPGASSEQSAGIPAVQSETSGTSEARTRSTRRRLSTKPSREVE